MLPGSVKLPLPVLIPLLVLIGTTPPASPSSAGSDAAEGQDRVAARIESARQRIWWNSAEVVEALGLSPEQRARMDAALGDMLEEVLDKELESEAHRQREALAEALDQRRWEAARAASRRLEEIRERPARELLELRVEVLSALTDAQWDVFRTDYGHLLTQPWVRLGRMAGPRATSRDGKPRSRVEKPERNR